MDSDLVYQPCADSAVRVDLDAQVAEYIQDPSRFELIDFERRFPLDIEGSTYHMGESNFRSSLDPMGFVDRDLEGSWPLQDEDIPF